MNRSVAFDKLGGLYVFQDTLDFLQIAYSQVNDAIARGLGDKYILTGCAITGGTMSDGWIVSNGELIPFIGGVVLDKVIIQILDTPEQFADGHLKPTYTTKRALFTSIAGAGVFPFADLKRLPIATEGIMGNLSNLFTMISSILNFEPEIILSGCSVNVLPTQPTTITSGVVLFNNKIVNAPAYSGITPCYFTETGSYTTVQPTAGSFIKFDPYTSQYYVDVLKRAMTPIGEIKIYESLRDRFDLTTGLGKWDMKGFQLFAEMQGRVPIGLWYDNVAVANVTDDAFKTQGATGGEKLHQLTVNEMPEHDHSMPNVWNENGGGHVASGGNSNEGAITDKTGKTGGNDAHNNLQPYKVIVYVKRVL